MGTLTAQRLAANAYRTLGLSGSASQADIDGAARRMRIWPDPASIPPTPWDMPWLGPLGRSRNDIEQAVATLNAPPTRIEERLVWFNAEHPELWSSGNLKTINKALRALPGPIEPALSHDIALARLQFALLQDPEFRDADRWTGVLAKLGELAESDAYLACCAAIEERGEFEKRARPEEIERATQSLQRSVAESIAARADSAAEDDDFSAATRIVSILRVGAPDVFETCRGRMAERLESLVFRRCDHLHHDVDPVGGPGLNKVRGCMICTKQGKFYAQSVEPLLAQLQDVAGGDSDRLLRARTEAARAKAHLAQAWAIVREFTTAEKLLISALELGAGTPVERPIRENLERCRATMKRKSASAARGSGPPVKRGQAFVPTYLPGSGHISKSGTAIAFTIVALILVSTIINPPPTPNASSFDPTALNSELLRRPLDAPTVSINNGPAQLADLVGHDASGSDLFSISIGGDQPDVAAHQYAAVGEPFRFTVGHRVGDGTGSFNLRDGPGGLTLHSSTGVGKWTPRPDQAGWVQVEVVNGAAAGSPVLRLGFRCYRFNAPWDVAAKVSDAPTSRSARPAVVSWKEPVFAVGLSGYKLTLINIASSESREFVAGTTPTTTLPDIPPGQYLLKIAAVDTMDRTGLSSDLVVNVPAPELNPLRSASSAPMIGWRQSWQS